MDKFVKDAFKEAMETQAKDEFKAWMNFSDRDFMVAHAKVIEQVGIVRINELCRAARLAGQADTLAEYAHSLMMMAFHVGYKARREEEGCQDR